MAPKRAIPSSSNSPVTKKVKLNREDEIAAEEEITPIQKLYDSLSVAGKVKALPVKKDSVVVYWMRNKDLRLEDNRALKMASDTAQRLNTPLIILHILSTGDFKSHSISPRRIDFQMRALASIQTRLIAMNVPLHTPTMTRRKQVPAELAILLEKWNCSHLYGNIEYEVDELARDLEVVESSTSVRENGGAGWGGQVVFLKDFCVIAPNEVLTQQGKPYAVFGAWYKNWTTKLSTNSQTYLADAGTLLSNSFEIVQANPIGKLLLLERVPAGVEGFMLDAEEQETMNHIWPVGTDPVTGREYAQEVLDRFIKTKSRPQVFNEPPLHPGAEEVELSQSKIGQYAEKRSALDVDGTSHLSPYLAAGIISPRAVLRATIEISPGKRLMTEKSTGVGNFVSEVAWRDFYQHVLAAWPRVCRGRPFNLKFDNIVWEENDAGFEAWKEGKTGFPIVDAGMRALKQQGYMHNRCRMITATFLAKDLLLDWRKGEKWFMEQLIDGDLGSNNGGWQWSASTGTDSQPYFRVFNPVAQSTKSDVSGDYIRHFIPELASLSGKELHNPSAANRARLGYPKEIVDHGKARIRAIARYKTPGTSDSV